MGNEMEASHSTASPVTVDEIRRALVEDSGWLTVDEILAAPIGEVEAELADQGLVSVARDEELLIAPAGAPPPRQDWMGRKRKMPGAIPAELLPVLVDRPEVVAALHEMVMEHSLVVVTGPSGAGKSSFVLGEYLRDKRVCADLPRRIVIDCTALQMASSVSFSREAVWAHFGIDDRGFKAFLADVVRDKTRDALTALMEVRLARGGIVVFDHVEWLDRSGVIDGWLTGVFLRRARELGVKVVFIDRGPATHVRPTLRDLAHWSLPDISAADVTGWLDHPGLRRLRAASLSVRAIMAMTGGRPTLLRDLELFLRHRPGSAGAGDLRVFRKWRLRGDQFFADCERLIRAARGHPAVLQRALAPGGLSAPWAEAELPAAAACDLLATGAVRRDGQGMLVFASPLYRRRLQRLLQPDALAELALRTGFRMLSAGHAKTLKRFGELASDALAKSLGYEKNPIVGLQKLTDFLSRWDFSARIYLRDRDNARLWAPYDKPERIGPLECWMQPDFAQAAQTGQLVRADDGRIFIPVISNAGVVGLVLVLEFLQRASSLPYSRQLEVDRVAGVLSGIRPTLAQLVQRLALHRERKFLGKIWFKSKSPELPPGRHGLLREVGCQSIIVFERRASCNWVVARFERTGDGEDDFHWTEGFSATRLEAIARHPSKRGLVLSGDHALDVFPRLATRSAAVYLHPVPRSDDAVIVAFLFDGPTAVLDGHVQAKLAGVAPDLLASAA